MNKDTTPVQEQAVFAAGCFWGVQYYFDQIPGVLSSAVGYTGGHTEEPTYEDVCSHTTGHAEAVWVDFDPTVVSYETLVRHFFRLHDPTQLNRQGPDVGDQYRSAIFTISDEQEETAERVLDDIKPQYDDPVVTVVDRLGPFYKAEDYHQKYAETTGRGMCHIPYEPLN